MVAKVFAVTPLGFDGRLIEVEGDATKGLPSLQIVGLGSKAIDEARERVKSAITNSLLEYPAKRITINLAPAELPKDGSQFDIAIALAILVSSGQIKQSEVNDAVFVGELALDGTVRPVKGIISIAETAKHHGLTTLYVPSDNVEQALLIDGVVVMAIRNLKELYLHLKRELLLKPAEKAKDSSRTSIHSPPLLDDIYGQEQAKRALIIAAAGRHNILFTGSPGAGKTMLAKALANLLPPLSNDEIVATTKLHSLAGEVVEKSITKRPFRAPHHTASRIALTGGGTNASPGEISLAHLGVLFLDEIPEYPRATLEILRQPLEDKHITISRARGHSIYPADFMLVATMNPCPCGYYGDTERECSCSSTQILSYQKRLSGPLLDRIDMVIPVSKVPNESLLDVKLSSKEQQENAHVMIKRAVNMQRDRYKSSVCYNSSLQSPDVTKHITLSPDVRGLLKIAAEKLKLSARGYFKVIKVARTIADLEGSPSITKAHLTEALQYRQPTT